MFGKGWESGEATIIALNEIRSVGRHGGIDVGGAKMKSYEFVADVRPAGGGAVFRTVMHEPFDERTWRRPSVGDVVTVKCDPAGEKAKFDTGPATAASGTVGALPEPVSRMKEILAQARGDIAADQVAARSAQDAHPASDDRLDRLAKLADLHDRGALTDEEFAAEKVRILADS
jgi:hypothetical protein